MYLEVSRAGAEPEVTLVDPHDFKSFKILVRSGIPVNAAQGALREVADFVDERNARVSIEALRDMSGCRDDTDWNAGFAAMLAYAESAGWVTTPGRVDAHCEYEAAEAP